MTVNQALRSAILPLVPICEPDNYDGNASEYCTFVYDDSPEIFADGAPHAIRRLLVLHWYLPRNVDPLEKKRQICRALLDAGFTYPYVQNATDGVGQHFIFECEFADGDV